MNVYWNPIRVCTRSLKSSHLLVTCDKWSAISFITAWTFLSCGTYTVKYISEEEEREREGEGGGEGGRGRGRGREREREREGEGGGREEGLGTHSCLLIGPRFSTEIFVSL